MLLAGTAFCQSPTHSVTLTWQDNINPPDTLYTVRHKELSPTVETGWTTVCKRIPTKLCVDLDVVAGAEYVYYATAVNPVTHKESKDSNKVIVTIPTP